MNLPVLPGVSIRLIQRIVCDRFGLAIDVMQSPSRKPDDAHPRQIAMRLSREFTGKSFHTIGRYFGGRDHTTIIHAIRAIERRNQRSACAPGLRRAQGRARIDRTQASSEFGRGVDFAQMEQGVRPA